jgi:hypothetical protein
MTPASQDSSRPIDLELIAQRILKLAEIATLEHLELLLESQAGGILRETHAVESV